MPTLLEESLPPSFDFYHLGRIELDDAKIPIDLEGHFAIGFRFEGEARGVLLLLVGEGLDASTYSEAGNIIASRMASDLYAHHGLDVTISPPHVLSDKQLKAVFAAGTRPLSARAYVHRHRELGKLGVPLQAVLLPAAPLSWETN